MLRRDRFFSGRKIAEKARQDAVDIDRQNGYNKGKTKRGEKQYGQIYGRDF